MEWMLHVAIHLHFAALRLPFTQYTVHQQNCKCQIKRKHTDDSSVGWTIRMGTNLNIWLVTRK